MKRLLVEQLFPYEYDFYLSKGYPNLNKQSQLSKQILRKTRSCRLISHNNTSMKIKEYGSSD
ncbi:hypothetical protein C1H46_011305 [Malus baccata]|uniref:Uncharacterized protein n=1 Tax=Malus baccata TaxID=106549 RepID=A0A540MWG2_MALBA|nr:hypothetical protein C1H46_011305 [Malus baccata]